jgi:uncharacterized protein (DUF849 family)
MNTVAGRPLLITVAPNGARRTKSDHAALPITPAEIAVTASRCAHAGAGMLHLHVRDDSGKHSLAPPHYRAALKALAAQTGPQLLVQATTEACGAYSVGQQMNAVRELRPEAASFAIREFFPDQTVDREVAAFFAWAVALGIACQFIVYLPSEGARLQELVRGGAIPLATPHALFVLGRYGDGPASDPAALDQFLAAWPPGWPWSVCAFGPSELAVMERAIHLGGHVRVGFENNLDSPDGKPLGSNEARVRDIAHLAAVAGRPLLDGIGARHLFIPPESGL